MLVIPLQLSVVGVCEFQILKSPPYPDWGALYIDWRPQRSREVSQTSRGHDYGTSLAGSSLFFEINEIIATSFGETGRMDMSATHYSVGISIDFR